MNEFVALFTECWNNVWNNAFFRVCLSTLLVVLPINCILRLLDPFSSSLGLFDFLCEMGSWLKNKFIDLAIIVLGFEKVYKLGWARPGVDFFECGQDCADCPKYCSCDSSLCIDLDSDDEL